MKHFCYCYFLTLFLMFLCFSQRQHNICSSGNTSVLIFVNEPKTWREAQSHCWTLSSDLVSIHSAVENKAVFNTSAPRSIWTGIFRDQWKWSDGRNSSFPFWGSSKPSHILKWSDRNSNYPNSFICFGESFFSISLKFQRC
uniref:C-type lectin domain-containing protein n=1 Tax=Nothobranchius furzeri TaxID=105023 RepID=A0A8C6KHL1_NOTFU